MLAELRIRLDSGAFWLGGFVLVAALGMYACGDGEGPGRSAPPPTSTGSGYGGAGGDDVATGSCDEGEIRGCKVWLDENNCFVGEQQCQGNMWSDCLEPGSFDGAGGQG